MLVHRDLERITRKWPNTAMDGDTVRSPLLAPHGACHRERWASSEGSSWKEVPWTWILRQCRVNS